MSIKEKITHCTPVNFTNAEGETKVIKIPTYLLSAAVVYTGFAVGRCILEDTTKLVNYFKK